MGSSAELLAIDDNSPDGTGRLADELTAGIPRLHVLHRSGKLGLGTAILAGMRFTLEHGFDLFVNMDADFSHRPRYLPAILVAMDQNDITIGSRYIPGGGSENWPLLRQIISRSVNTLVSLLMRIPARDCRGAYRCYRVDKLREVRLERISSRIYSFQQEILYRWRQVGCRIGETTILFENRRAGKSKVDAREAVRSLAMIFRIVVPAFLGLD
jgi:dolichol-phosphate mannosyltransferase